MPAYLDANTVLAVAMGAGPDGDSSALSCRRYSGSLLARIYAPERIQMLLAAGQPEEQGRRCGMRHALCATALDANSSRRYCGRLKTRTGGSQGCAEISQAAAAGIAARVEADDRQSRP